LGDIYIFKVETPPKCPPRQERVKLVPSADLEFDDINAIIVKMTFVYAVPPPPINVIGHGIMAGNITCKCCDLLKPPSADVRFDLKSNRIFKSQDGFEIQSKW
jgi:hypothetical protein